MSYRINLVGINNRIIVVGCGGTGGFVAEGLCRLLGRRPIELLLIDHDRVEERNRRRQNFFREDLGRFKSEALAQRLARLYGREIGYSILPFDAEMTDYEDNMFVGHPVQGLIIGCVDNAAARRDLSRAMNGRNWWLDAGNDEHAGQVLLGNIASAEDMEGAFWEEEGVVGKLPCPALQQPALLIPAAARETTPACAEAVEIEAQSPVINQAMAALALQFVYLLLKDELSWTGAYLDLAAGTLATVPAEPVTVARMLGMKVSSLMMKPACGRGGMMMNPRPNLVEMGVRDD